MLLLSKLTFSDNMGTGSSLTQSFGYLAAIRTLALFVPVILMDAKGSPSLWLRLAAELKLGFLGRHLFPYRPIDRQKKSPFRSSKEKEEF